MFQVVIKPLITVVSDEKKKWKGFSPNQCSKICSGSVSIGSTEKNEISL